MIARNDIIELCDLLKTEMKRTLNIREFDFEELIINGSVSNKIIGECGVYARTFFVGKRMKLFIVLNDDINMLKRLYTHEYVHGVRLKILNIMCDREYIKYLSDINNWIIEEVLALSAEKRICKIGTWEEAIGFDFNPEWKLIKSQNFSYDKIVEGMRKKEVIELAKSFDNSNSSIMYYIVYVIAKKLEFDKLVEFFLNKTSREIEEYIVNAS